MNPELKGGLVALLLDLVVEVIRAFRRKRKGGETK